MKTHFIGNTSLKVTELGFGAASLGNLYRPMSATMSMNAVATAWDLGYKLFDTAPFYGFGLSERRLGDTLREVANGEYILSTKVGRLLKPGEAREKFGFCSPMPFDPVYDYSYDGVMRSFEQSLQRLGLARIDIIYMHDIGRATHGKDHERQFKIAMEGGFKAMDELRSQGLVSAIGLGVNEHEVCEQAMKYTDFDCFLLAGRYTLLEQGALSSFLPKCIEKNISIILGGVYNSGILATGTEGPSVPYYDYVPASNGIIKRVRQIEAVCSDFDVQLAVAALQFPLSHPAVVSVIPGLNSPTRVEQTLSYLNTSIPAEFWVALRDKNLIDPNTPLPLEETVA